MKVARLWLLVVLAVLIPVRGAVAAAMLCQLAAPAQAQMAAHDHGAMHGDHAAAHEHDDRCNMCAGFCSVMPLVDSTASGFVRGGPERPPRSA